jgi:hypothetical protein
MSSWKEVTLGDLARGFSRYRPFVLAVAAVLAVAILLPGRGENTRKVTAANSGTTALGDATGTTVAEATATDGGATVAGGASAGGATARVRAGTPGAGGNTALSFTPGPDCDTATGRIKVPSLVAPPCQPKFSGNNGGSTAPGVTAKEIKVVFYQPQDDAATQAALTAAGAANTPDQVWQTYQEYTDYFNKFYEGYGRKIVLTRVQGSGAASDPAAANADAQNVVGMRPFAVWGGNLPSFYEVLARNKILCICTTSQPQETYEKSAPYVGYTPLMSSTQAYIHRAEYIGKRLAGRKAVHAGSAVTQQKDRVFGLLYYETADKAYRAGAEFFRKEITRYGTSFKDVLPYRGPPDYSGLQEDVRPLIQRLKDDGVTSIACACDPISPALFTKEATRQNYQPEWIITGSALTDTDLFARTYDTAQWRNAFGVSLLTARVPKAQAEAWKVYQFHYPGKTPPADNQYGVIYPVPLAFFTGVHMAGANLTVQSWQKGLNNFPVTNRGRKTQATVSYGQHGIWSFADYTGFDDVTEIWWDPTTVGPDELDNQGAGMYQYVDGGKRYLPGEHPKTDPKAFVKEGTVTIYDTPPPGESVPNYPHTPYH